MPAGPREAAGRGPRATDGRIIDKLLERKRLFTASSGLRAEDHKLTDPAVEPHFAKKLALFEL